MEAPRALSYLDFANWQSNLLFIIFCIKYILDVNIQTYTWNALKKSILKSKTNSFQTLQQSITEVNYFIKHSESNYLQDSNVELVKMPTITNCLLFLSKCLTL